MPISRRLFIAACAAGSLRSQPRRFNWPFGKRAAMSFTFDDARVSQIDTGIPFLNKTGLTASFYMSPRGFRQRVEGWKEALAAGHELAHHSNTHPCTANYRFSKGNALEDYTLESMAADLDAATAEMQSTFGVKPVSFAYPCGQKFVGRGANARSYVPLIAERFLSGRGYLDEAANDPEVCDLASLMGTGFDGLDYAAMRRILDAAASEGRWVIFAGHDMGKPAHQSVDLQALERLWRYIQDPAQGIWAGTVAEVAGYIRTTRGL